MNRNLATLNWSTVLSGAVGVAAVFLVTAYLLGMQVPWVSTDRAAVVALAATGFLMCTLSLGRTTTTLGWRHPITVIGVGLGVLILALGGVVLAGWRLPFLPSDRAAFILLAVLGLSKWGLGFYSRTYLKS